MAPTPSETSDTRVAAIKSSVIVTPRARMIARPMSRPDRRGPLDLDPHFLDVVVRIRRRRPVNRPVRLEFPIPDGVGPHRAEPVQGPHPVSHGVDPNG